MEKEKWINEVLTSADGLRTVTPNPTLYNRIMRKIERESTVSSNYVWLAAASIALLVLLNVLALKSRHEGYSDLEVIASSIVKSNQLYR